MAAQADRDCGLPQKADEIALTCLLLYSEWGKQFSKAAVHQAAANTELASTRFPALRLAFLDVASWIDALAWRLCSAHDAGGQGPDSVIAELVSGLTHNQSAVRSWMMEIAWMVRPSIPVDRAVPQLLKNVADTLGGVRMAVGLASALCSSDEVLESFIGGCQPPDMFADQFANRIKSFREEGFFLSQAYFWSLESRCRRMIEQTVLG